MIKDFITKQILHKLLVKALSCTHTETFTADHHVLCHETNPAEAEGGQTELSIKAALLKWFSMSGPRSQQDQYNKFH